MQVDSKQNASKTNNKRKPNANKDTSERIRNANIAKNFTAQLEKHKSDLQNKKNLEQAAAFEMLYGTAADRDSDSVEREQLKDSDGDVEMDGARIHSD